MAEKRSQTARPRRLRAILLRTLAKPAQWIDEDERANVGRGIVAFWHRLIPNTRASTNVMEYQARLLSDAAQIDEAIVLQRNALDRRIRMQGPTHPATLVSETLLGLYLLQADRYQEASVALEHALSADPTQSLADRGFSTRSLVALVDAFRFQDRFTEGERFLNSVIDACRQMLGDDDIKTLTARFQLSRVLAYGGEQERAFRAHLSHDRVRLDPGLSDHPSLAAAVLLSRPPRRRR